MTPEEIKQVLTAKEQRFQLQAGYSPLLNDPARIALTRQREELDEKSRAGVYGPLPSNLPSSMLQLIKKIQDRLHRGLPTTQGFDKPVVVETNVIREIIEMTIADITEK